MKTHRAQIRRLKSQDQPEPAIVKKAIVRPNGFPMFSKGRPIKLNRYSLCRSSFQRLQDLRRHAKRKAFAKLPPLKVYSDGSRLKDGSSSGIGVVCGPNHHVNFRKKLSYDIALPHLSTIAEIEAASEALKRIAEWDIYDGRKVVVWVDLQHLFKAMRIKIKDQWKHREQLNGLKVIAQYFPSSVEFNWMNSHSDHPYNDLADQIANNAAKGIGKLPPISWRINPSPQLWRKRRSSVPAAGQSSGRVARPSSIDFNWMNSHKGHPYNELADEVAKNASCGILELPCSNHLLVDQPEPKVDDKRKATVRPNDWPLFPKGRPL